MTPDERKLLIRVARMVSTLAANSGMCDTELALSELYRMMLAVDSTACDPITLKDLWHA